MMDFLQDEELQVRKEVFHITLDNGIEFGNRVKPSLILENGTTMIVVTTEQRCARRSRVQKCSICNVNTVLYDVYRSFIVINGQLSGFSVCNNCVDFALLVLQYNTRSDVEEHGRVRVSYGGIVKYLSRNQFLYTELRYCLSELLTMRGIRVIVTLLSMTQVLGSDVARYLMQVYIDLHLDNRAIVEFADYIV